MKNKVELKTSTKLIAIAVGMFIAIFLFALASCTKAPVAQPTQARENTSLNIRVVLTVTFNTQDSIYWQNNTNPVMRGYFKTSTKEIDFTLPNVTGQNSMYDDFEANEVGNQGLDAISIVIYSNESVIYQQNNNGSVSYQIPY